MTLTETLWEIEERAKYLRESVQTSPAWVELRDVLADNARLVAAIRKMADTLYNSKVLGGSEFAADYLDQIDAILRGEKP